MEADVNHPLQTYFQIVFLVAVRYALVAGGAYLLLWVIFRRRLEPRKLVRSELPKGQLRRELAYSLQSFFLFSLFGLANVYISQLGLGLYYPEISDYGWGYWAASVVFMLALNDFHFYWTHRLLHWAPLYRRFHSVHHASRQTTPLTSQSFHAVEVFVSLSVVLAIPFVMPLHSSAYVTFALLAFLNNVYGHAGYELWPREWARRFPLNLLNLSSMHSWHHMRVHGNYGLYTTVWDRLFGTYRDPFEAPGAEAAPQSISRRPRPLRSFRTSISG